MIDKSELKIALLAVSGLFALSFAMFSGAETIGGDKLYRENCARCHGADGKGTQVLRQIMGLNVIDLSSVDQAITMSELDLNQLLIKGRPESGMPAFGDKLSAAEREALINHLKTHIMNIPDNVADLRQGQKIFQRHCSVCHGDKGQVAIWARAGLEPDPANFTDERKKKELKRERMLFSVANGRPETAMPSWYARFSKQQIENVVDYIRVALMQVSQFDKELGFAEGQGAPESDPFLSAKDFDESQVDKIEVATQPQQNQRRAPDPFLDSPSYDPSKDVTLQQSADIFDPLNSSHDHNAHFGGDLDEPLPAGLVGDRERGKQLFDDNCAVCHGKKGDGKGPRSKFIFPKPRNFHHPAVVNRFTRSHIFTQVSKGIVGSVMPAWKTVLDRQQIADITEYVFMDVIHGGVPPKTSSEQQNEQSGSEQ